MQRAQLNVVKRVSIFVFFLMGIIHVSAQVQTNRTNVGINSNINGFVEYLPQGYDPLSSVKYPLLISFMGLNAQGPGNDDASLELLYQPGFIPKLVRDGQFPSSFTVNGQTYKFIIITPQFVINFNTRRPRPHEVNDLIDYCISHYRVDTSRIYLVGNSSGAEAPWNYAGFSSAYANRIAAMVPLSGTQYPSEEKANKIKYANTAVWAFHNTNDPSVPFAFTKDLYDMLRRPPAPFPDDRIKGTFPTPPSPFHDLSYGPYTGSYTENGLNIYQWMLQFSRTITKANAGIDLDISLPQTSVQLNGAGTGPNGNASIYNWVKMSGPNSPNFSSNAVANPTISNLVVGTYVFRLGITDNNNNTSTDEITVRVYPPRVQAENYIASNGGVMIAPTVASEDGQDLGYFDLGDWVEYNVNVPVAGTYPIRFRISSFIYGAQFKIKNTSGTVLATVDPIYTESWDTFATNVRNVALLAGNQVIRIESTSNEGFGFNWFQVMEAANLAPLPVNFILFNTSCVNGSVNLLWKTSGETDSRDFTIERSADGRGWQAIATVPSSGQSTSERSYSFADHTTGSGGFYRIAQTDLNGRKTYSSIIRSSCSGKYAFTLYPNPVVDKAILNLSVDQNTRLNLSLFDVRGARVQVQQVEIPKGSNQVTLDMNNLPKGTYTLQAQWDAEIKTIKLVKN